MAPSLVRMFYYSTAADGSNHNVPNEYFLIKARNDNAFYIYFQIKNVNFSGPVDPETHIGI